MNINDIKLNPNNPRFIKDERYQKLKKNMQEFPKMMKLRPIIIDDNGMIIGGNMRYLAMKDLGYKDIPEGWVVKASGLTEEERRRFVITDNIPYGDWDYDKLANEWEMTELQDWGINIDELEEARVNMEDIEDDYDIEKAIEEIKEPKCKAGDIWQLNSHKLMCGDSTKKEDIEKLMSGAKADIVFTDPPYNVNYSGQGKLGGIKNDNMTEECFVEFVIEFTTVMQNNLKIGGVFYMCSGWSSYPIFLYAIKSLGMNFANPIVWVKNNTTLGWNDYKYKYEMIVKGKKKKEIVKKKSTPILYGWNGGKHYFIDSRFESDVWEIKRRASNTMIHPTQKPIGLINKALSNSSKPGEIVLDLFGGSGATLISCERLNRICRINELDPIYCDMIIKRWEDYTNKKAVKING